MCLTFGINLPSEKSDKWFALVFVDEKGIIARAFAISLLCSNTLIDKLDSLLLLLLRTKNYE